MFCSIYIGGHFLGSRVRVKATKHLRKSHKSPFVVILSMHSVSVCPCLNETVFALTFCMWLHCFDMLLRNE